MLFGQDDTINCIQNISAPGPGGEPLCLAYKYSTHSLGAPAYLTNDGYVLKIVGQDRYIPLDQARIASLQADGTLPTPLPHYSISPLAYLWGYSLWIILVVVGVLTWFGSKRKKARMAADAALPISAQPPALNSAGDHFIHDQVTPLLGSGERITHQAYGTDRVVAGLADGLAALGAKGVLAALTSKRLFLIKTKVGAFSPVLENQGVEELERTAIREVTRDGQILEFKLLDGTTRTLVVDARKKHFSNQDVFVRDVPRLLGATALATAAPSAAG